MASGAGAATGAGGSPNFVIPVDDPPAAPAGSSRSSSFCDSLKFVPMVGGEASAVVVAIANAYFLGPGWLVALPLLTGLACGFAHWEVWKYANVAKMIAEEKQNVAKLEKTVEEQGAKVNQLSQALGIAQETNVKTGEEIQQLGASVALAKKNEADTGVLVADLKNQIDVLQTTLANVQKNLQGLPQPEMVAKWTANYAEQNNALEKAIKELGEVPLGTLSGSLTAGGKSIDVALQELVVKIQEFQSLSATIIQGMQAQNNAQASDIKGLQETYAKMTAAEQSTRAELDQVMQTLKALQASQKPQAADDALFLSKLDEAIKAFGATGGSS